MKKNCILTFLILFFLFPRFVYGATINLQSGTSQLKSSTDEYDVNVTVSLQAADNSPYFLRGVFYKSGTTNYCGYTWNGTAWFNGPYSTNEGWKNFLPITIQNNSWSGQVRAKLDLDDNGCKDSGTFNFKIERFTPTGSGTFDSQNEQTFTVFIPTPTFTPTPSPKPTPTTPPTSTPKPSPTPTKIPQTVTRSLSVSPLPTIDILVSPLFASDEAILGASISATPVPSEITPLEKAIAVHTSSSKEWIFFIVAGGVILLCACGILAYRIYKKKHGE